MLTRLLDARGTRILGCLVMIALVLAITGQVWAQEEAASGAGAAASVGQAKFVFIWFVAFLGSIAALVQAYLFYKWVVAADQGTERMIEIAGYVRQGANAYLRQQYIVV